MNKLNKKTKINIHSKLKKNANKNYMLNTFPTACLNSTKRHIKVLINQYMQSLIFWKKTLFLGKNIAFQSKNITIPKKT